MLSCYLKGQRIYLHISMLTCELAQFQLLGQVMYLNDILNFTWTLYTNV